MEQDEEKLTGDAMNIHVSPFLTDQYGWFPMSQGGGVLGITGMPCSRTDVQGDILVKERYPGAEFHSVYNIQTLQTQIRNGGRAVLPVLFIFDESWLYLCTSKDKKLGNM